MSDLPVESSSQAQRCIHVVGAARGIGRWFVEHIFGGRAAGAPTKGWSCIAYDRDPAVTSLMGTATVVLDAASGALNSRLGARDIVVLALPLDALEATVCALAPAISPQAVVISFTSVQVQSKAILQRYLGQGGQVLGCHPLFGPGIESPVGAYAVLVDSLPHIAAHAAFRQLLIDAGLGVVELAADEHDEAMALVQSLTHFSLLSFASTLAVLRERPAANPERLAGLRTPNFRFLHAFASRLLTIQSTTTGSIQLGEAAQRVREVFIAQAEHLHHEFNRCQHASQAGDLFATTRRALRGPALADGADFAAQAVSRLLRVDADFFAALQHGRPIVLRHRITGHFRLTRIVALHPEQLHIAGRVGWIERNGQRYVIPWLTPQACMNYAKLGFGDPRRRFLLHSNRDGEEVIVRRHVEVLDAQAQREWMAQHVLPVRAQIRCPAAITPMVRHLPRLIDGLWQATLNSWSGRHGERFVSLEFAPDLEASAIATQIQALLAE